jgi:hypothetical protein
MQRSERTEKLSQKLLLAKQRHSPRSQIVGLFTLLALLVGTTFGEGDEEAMSKTVIRFVLALNVVWFVSFAAALIWRTDALFMLQNRLFFVAVGSNCLLLLGYLVSGFSSKASERVAPSIVRVVGAPFRRLWLRRSSSRPRDLRAA